MLLASWNLLGPETYNGVARACAAESIDRDERKGQPPSDHAPVLATLDLP